MATNEVVYQFSYRGGEWKACDKEGYESRLGNWDFELRELQVIGSEIETIATSDQVTP